MQRLPWIVLLAALTCIAVPAPCQLWAILIDASLEVIIRGCIPMHKSCAYGTCTPLLVPRRSRKAARCEEFLPIYVWRWDFKPLEGSMLVLVRISHILAVSALYCKAHAKLRS